MEYSRIPRREILCAKWRHCLSGGHCRHGEGTAQCLAPSVYFPHIRHSIMVVYNLSCGNSHAFEGWFDSPEVYESQMSAAEIACPVCGSCDITRQPSAPYVARHRDGGTAKSARTQALEAWHALHTQLVEHVMQNSEDVGRDFPDEARRIHRQEAAERPIRGQATAGEARELREEGIDVMQLPQPPTPRDRMH